MAIPEPERADLVDLDRTTLRTWGWGDPADPLVLCLHGAYDHGRMFDGIAPRLAALGYHVVAVDFRGHGDSGPLDTGFAWTLLHLDLALLIRHLGGGPVGFVAHSFGGGQATGVAGAFPELVRWIVNIDGLGPPAAALVPPDQIPDAVRQSFDRTDRALLVDRRPVGVARGDGDLPRPQQPAAARRSGCCTSRATAPARSEGGWVWKADPMFGVGIPSEFNVAMLEAEMRHVRVPGPRAHRRPGGHLARARPTTSSPSAWRGSAPGTRWCRAPATTSTSRIPTRRWRHIEAFLAEVGP